MKQTRIFIIAMFIFLISDQLLAQKTIAGSVVESGSNEPLIGVSIQVTGTSLGTITDLDGNYTLSVPNDAISLTFSYTGYTNQTVDIGNQTTIDIQLKINVEQLEEVVVVGYGVTKKKDLTGAVNLLDDEDFNGGPNTSTQQLIQGKMAGVTVTTDNGAPGSGANILIRGVGSLNLTSNPLYVVDGLPLDVREPITNEATSGGVQQRGVRNPLNLINPNDIASITVLKDASATAIYGSRAANGVVVITTKSGASGDGKLNFNFNSKTTTSAPISFVDLLSADEVRNLVNGLNNPVLSSQLGPANTDWQNIIYNNAVGFDNALSTYGRFLGTDMRASVGYTNQDGILSNDNFERLTGSISISPKFLDNKLRFGLKGRFMNTQNSFGNQAAIGNATTFNPTLPVFDPNSPFGYTTYLNNEGTLQRPITPSNPQALIDLVSNNSTVNRYVASIKTDYDLPFLEGLTATINAGFDIVDSDGAEITSASAPTESVGFNGIQTIYNNKTTNLLFDAYMTYVKRSQNNSLSLTLGHSYQNFTTEDGFTRTDSFLDDVGNEDPNTTTVIQFQDEFESTLLSYFGRLNYDIDNKYLFTATLRADASSKLNPNDRWGLFPSMAFAWNLHKEDFFKSGWFDLLKVRVGYGEVGNVNGLADYTFLTRYFQSSPNANYQIGNDFFTTFRPEPINENLRWEVGNTLNAGIDYSFLDYRVSGSINYYVKKTKDLIAESIIDPLTNFGNSIPANIGDMTNRGFEFEIKGLIIDKKDFQFEVGYNLAYNDNEITRLENPQEVGAITGTLGDRIQRHEVGQAPFSFYVYKQIYDENENPIEGAFEDLNGDGVITGDDRYFYQDPFADFTMGATFSLSYKNFDFNVVSRFSLNNYVYNNNAAFSSFQQLINVDAVRNIHSSFLDTRWQNINTENLTSDYWIENASFLRLDNITLGYTINEVFNGSSLRLYATGSNLFVITDYSGIDPEVFNGIDNNFYPRPRVFTFGLDFNF